MDSLKFIHGSRLGTASVDRRGHVRLGEKRTAGTVGGGAGGGTADMASVEEDEARREWMVLGVRM